MYGGIKQRCKDPIMQSTKWGAYVKHHAARLLIYLGLGERVGNRANIFTTLSEWLMMMARQ